MTGAELRASGGGDQGVVTFRGELDAANAAAAAAAVLAASAGGGCMIVDLSAVGFIDCCALGALARVRQLARRAGGDVLLAGPREPVRRLLDLTGLSGVFSVHASAAAAAAFRGAAPRQPAALAAVPGGQPR
jgi:anti-sigma B factor antagonist